MVYIFFVIGLIVGLALGYFAFKVFKNKIPSVPLEQFNIINTEKISLEERSRALENDSQKQAQDILQKQNDILRLTGELATARSEAANMKGRLDDQKFFIEDYKKQMRTEFENLAAQVLEVKSKTFSEQTDKHLKLLLDPLKDKLTTFEKKVDDTYSTEAKERHALKFEIGRLIELNQQMSQETTNLTQALKGDNKFQGDWGELILEKLLESAGLRQGHEYHAQKQHLDSEGGKFKPDIIINLPEQKHIIIDSKVTLKSYQDYCSMDDSTLKQNCLKTFLASVNNHVQELSQKNYSKLHGINSPDFVLMFIPIEPAYLLAASEDSDLAMRAWKKGVAIVTTSTLFTSMRIVSSLWRLENQNKNAQEIASEGAKLYDKFLSFFEVFEQMGKTFDKGKEQYGTALGRLKTGPGNVFKKIETLRDLGAAPSKRIRQDLLE